MQYKRIQGKKCSQSDLEDGAGCSTTQNSLERYFEDFLGRGDSPKGRSYDGCIAIPIRSQKELDSEFSINMKVDSQQRRGERDYFPDKGEEIFVYVCDQEVAEIIDKALEKLNLPDMDDEKSCLERVREVLRI